MAAIIHETNRPLYTSFRQLFSRLIAGLAQTQAHEAPGIVSNPLHTTDVNVKHVLLSLHALFPNELLPALDILDRRLVNKCIFKQVLGAPEDMLQDPPPDRITATSRTRSVDDDAQIWSSAKPVVYYVRSGRDQAANKTKWRDASGEMAAHYEVRTRSWNCSCPAFSFAAFPAMESTETSTFQMHDAASLGARCRGIDLPVCKHILACVLVEQCPQFSHMCEEMEVGIDDIAGWAAGYGD